MVPSAAVLSLPLSKRFGSGLIFFFFLWLLERGAGKDVRHRIFGLGRTIVVAHRFRFWTGFWT